MKIHLVTSTPEPKKAIAAAFLNMGIGKDTTSLSEISDEQANDAISEIFKSHLDAPLEYASFNLFWQDIPLFMRAQLVRHRVGWGFAERSLRFFDAKLREDSVKNYDWEAIPTVTDKPTKNAIFGGLTTKQIVEREMIRQLELYGLLLEEGVDQQDARNIIGVFYPTAMQTTCTYRALRQMLEDRLSSQAHPFWQKAARQIKALVTEVDPVLGAGLIDGCEKDGKCRWRSKYDRDCASCIERGREKAHEHIWDRETSFGPNSQCNCGILKQVFLPKQ